jgi:glycosyltransferase involved in cell wall biosynthesis
VRQSNESSVVFVANGPIGSAAEERGRRIAAATAGPTHLLSRSDGRLRDAGSLLRRARSLNPDVVYCVDLAAVPVAVGLFSGRRSKLIVDTGDYPSAFLRQIGSHPVRIAAARLMEELVYRRAAAVVVRGRHHEAVMRGNGVRRIEVVPDGVDLAMVSPVSDPVLRARFGLSDVLTVGIAGSFTWYESLGGGLGWELVHALARVKDLPVHGVLIGEGPGITHLRVLAAELGVADRLHVLGRVPYDQYAHYLGLVDVCLLTQTNDASSWIRTTGKLPAYLAAGRYVLASSVGTAADLLPDEMLVDYEGTWDEKYPEKIAERLRTLVADPSRLAAGIGLRNTASEFDYSRVAARAARLIAEVREVPPR